MNMRDIGKEYKKQERSIFIEVPRTKLIDAAKRLKDRGVTRISSITGYDGGKGFEAIYHFHFRGQLINIKTKIDYKKPHVETITKQFPGAELFERELMEMVGVVVDNHPNPSKLFLCDDSPKCPLRKYIGKGGT